MARQKTTKAKFTFNRNGGEGSITIKGRQEFVSEVVKVLTAWATDREVAAEVAAGRDRNQVLNELLASLAEQARAQGIPFN
jgi:hypothetical protein